MWRCLTDLKMYPNAYVFFKNEMVYSLRFRPSCYFSGPLLCSHVWGQWALVHVIIRVLHCWVTLPSVPLPSVIILSGSQCFKAKAHVSLMLIFHWWHLVTWTNLLLQRMAYVASCWLTMCLTNKLLLQRKEGEQTWGEGIRNHPEGRCNLNYFPGSLYFRKTIWRLHRSLNDKDHHVYTVINWLVMVEDTNTVYGFRNLAHPGLNLTINVKISVV